MVWMKYSCITYTIEKYGIHVATIFPVNVNTLFILFCSLVAVLFLQIATQAMATMRHTTYTWMHLFRWIFISIKFYVFQFFSEVFFLSACAQELSRSECRLPVVCCTPQFFWNGSNAMQRPKHVWILWYFIRNSKNEGKALFSLSLSPSLDVCECGYLCVLSVSLHLHEKYRISKIRWQEWLSQTAKMKMTQMYSKYVFAQDVFDLCKLEISNFLRKKIT